MSHEFCWPEGKSLRVRRWNESFENSESRKVRSTSYVPLPNKHDGKGYSRIANHQRSCHIFTGWILILQVASKCPERGLLVDEDGSLDVDDIAVMTRFDVSIFELAIPILVDPKVGWLEWVDTPGSLQQNGRTQDTIPVSPISSTPIPDNPGTSRHVPARPDMPGRTEQKGTELNGTETTPLPPSPGGTPASQSSGGSSSRSTIPSARDLIATIPADSPYRDVAIEWAEYKQSQPAASRYRTERSWAVVLKKMAKYPPEVVTDAVESAIANGWKGWEFDSIKMQMKPESRTQPEGEDLWN